MLVDSALLDISDKEFNDIASLVFSRFGINLTDKKRTLVKGRLNKVVRQHGYSSFSQYYDAIMKDSSGKMLVELIDKISTNHTFFFREKTHFAYLESEILPELFKKISPDDLRIWCAGCATGEEAYSLGMTVLEYASPGTVFRGPVILATDISTRALTIAKEGKYAEQKINTIEKRTLQKYFIRNKDGEYEAQKRLKDLILFRRLNFFDDVYPFKGKFHIIFCRNVMIYFDNPTKMKLVEKLHNVTYPDGYLFIGHSETLGREQDLYRYITSAAYKKVTYG